MENNTNLVVAVLHVPRHVRTLRCNPTHALDFINVTYTNMQLHKTQDLRKVRFTRNCIT